MNMLPNPNTSLVNKEESLSPSNFRFITDSISFFSKSQYLKMMFVSFLSGVLVCNIIFQLMIFVGNKNKIQQISKERVSLTEEISYWKNTAQKYDGYRDAYFRIAALSYKVGNVTESKKYMEKTLELDPNFEAGRVLGAKIQR